MCENLSDLNEMCEKQAAFEAWIGQGAVRIHDSEDGFAPESCVGEYVVLTAHEANERCKDYIRESLWAFNVDFLEARCECVTYRTKKAVRKMQEELCEDANELIFAWIDDFDTFVACAIVADGRGHFLAPYDGEEHEVCHNGETYYIYRIG